MRSQRFVALVVFSGELMPDSVGAEAALRMAGFEVVRMPAKYRAHLCHPADDFFSVSKAYDSKYASSDAMAATLDEILAGYGAIADECGGPVGDDYAPEWWPT